MKPPSFMIVAGEPSGDTLGAELLVALRREWLARHDEDSADVQPLRTALAPQFFGAGGPQLAAAGADLACDLTRHSVIGVSGVLGQLLTFRRLLRDLTRLAVRRQPDALICVDFHGFNGRLARAVQQAAARRRGTFNNWRPRLIQFVSPQVWASRPWRADALADTLDLVLSIYPFEPAWYAARVPRLRVEFVGHPIVERFATRAIAPAVITPDRPARVLLLPGSRSGEVARHLPLVLDTARLIQARRPAEFRMVLPNDAFAAQARAAAQAAGVPLALHVGDIPGALAQTDVAVSKTGTVQLECALFGVPTVAFYQTSAFNYALGKRLVTVKWLSMPNLIANETLFPEFIQHAATPAALADAALRLLNDPAERARVQARLRDVVAQLGSPGATQRAAQHIANLWPTP